MSEERKKRRILLAEDDEFLRTLCQRILKQDYDITPTKNGKEAIEHYHTRKEEYDLLLTDTEMPEVSGIELVRTVRSYDSQIPIIGMSGEPQYRKKMTDAGANSFIIKPFDFRQLCDTIAEYTKAGGNNNVRI